jgi:hypothetical protein
MIHPSIPYTFVSNAISLIIREEKFTNKFFLACNGNDDVEAD